MARKQAPTSVEPIEERIVDIDVASEMETSFLEYAYSVIYARALPDARDGLKPVQRRILYMMADMGLRPDRPYVKSSRVIGEVMGKLHPHGDQAIYDALVRMAQDFSLRLPLVDGHGNFGSLDDGPAAPRYTEARPASASAVMTAGLDEDVVDFVPNYDNKLVQPEVLPSAIPNLLVNGASGIAVGMATNMAPHNLVEVVTAGQYLLTNPDATLEDVMRFIPGPDLPTGGKIVGLDGVRDAYRTGRGVFRARATARIENITARRRGIVITELPYLVGPEKVIEKISDGVKSKKIQGISAVTDLTDRKNGLRVVVEVKTGFDPEAVLEQLYRTTPLEDSFGINNVALVDGQPRTLGLLELLQVWVAHRLDVVRRRSAFRLGKRRERLHLIEGLLIAIVDIDEVIQVIRSSDDAAVARERLMGVFDLSEAQANYILDLQLRRLTKFSRIELEREQSELLSEITHLEEILGSDAVLRRVVSAEMGEVAATFGTPRRTVLLETAGALPGPGANGVLGLNAMGASKSGPGATVGASGRKTGAISLEIADTPTHVLLSATGLLARVPTPPVELVSSLRSSAASVVSESDRERSVLLTPSPHENKATFTEPIGVPTLFDTPSDDSDPLPDEPASPVLPPVKPASPVILREVAGSPTASASSPATAAAVPRTGRRQAHDALRADLATTSRSDIGLVTTLGRIVRISALDLPSLPPTDGAPSMAGGVPVAELVELAKGEEVLTLISLADDAPTLALGTAQGVVKRVAQGDIPNNRDEWEVIALKDGDTVIGAAPASDDDELVFITSDSSLLHFDASAVRPQGRAAGGMAGIKLAPKQNVVFFSVAPAAQRSELVVATVAGAMGQLAGFAGSSVKVTPYELYPGKGRATGGVRSHRFLKGENCLVLAWVGPAPARAVGPGGQPVDLPELDQRRDGSGSPIKAPIAAIG